ncbi:DoxX family protein [Nocardia sp. NBC_01730]|uniref:DoxX family protein n=1 Tax=Nocardia sp. NBC_01730 TaxID=2975998 RepID=UPI002E0F0B81|nr:DoxX family protein [Nocardia sp. NBC_01730]
MSTSIAEIAVTGVTIAMTGFSGIAAILHFKPILEPMTAMGVPESWLIFPIGIPKTAGAVGLLLGLLGVPLIGPVAAIGIVLYFVCALGFHVRERAYTPQFVLAIVFVGLGIATLTLQLT